MSNNSLENLTNKQLKQLIRDTKKTLADLDAEKERRRTEARHDDIEHLDEVLEGTHASLFDLKKLIDVVFGDKK